MKKQNLLFTLILSVFFFVNAKSQSNDDYFIGKWKVNIVGTPLGDFTWNFLFEKTGDQLTGVVRDTTGVEVSKITNVKVKDKAITGNFKYDVHDITISLEQIEADSVKGNALGVFAAKGVRIKAK